MPGLDETDPGTRVTWMRRSTDAAVQGAFSAGSGDQLTARGALDLRANAAVEAGVVDVQVGAIDARFCT